MPAEEGGEKGEKPGLFVDPERGRRPLLRHGRKRLGPNVYLSRGRGRGGDLPGD